MTVIWSQKDQEIVSQLNEVDLLERGNPRLVTTGEEKPGGEGRSRLATRADVAAE